MKNFQRFEFKLFSKIKKIKQILIINLNHKN